MAYEGLNKNRVVLLRWGPVSICAAGLLRAVRRHTTGHVLRYRIEGARKKLKKSILGIDNALVRTIIEPDEINKVQFCELIEIGWGRSFCKEDPAFFIGPHQPRPFLELLKGQDNEIV